MNKRGDLWENAGMDAIIYGILAVFFLILGFFTIYGYNDGAALWQDLYSKEIVRLVDGASPGDEFRVDVSRGVGIAFDNDVLKSDIFSFDNVNNNVIVKLTPKTSKSFSFYNNVDVVNWSLEGPSGGADTTRLYFKVVEVQSE